MEDAKSVSMPEAEAGCIRGKCRHDGAQWGVNNCEIRVRRRIGRQTLTMTLLFRLRLRRRVN